MKTNAWILFVVSVTAIVACLPCMSRAAVVDYTGGTYSQNFDGLGTSGTTFPVAGVPFTAWDTDATDAAIIAMISDIGSDNAGGIRNVGVAGVNAATDRALGSLGSSSRVPAFGLNIQNNTGGTIGEFTVSYRSELWRSGSSGTTTEIWNFQYAVVSSEISMDSSATTWINFDSLDMSELNPTLTDNAPKDGNASGNFATISANLSVAVNNGEYLVFRWVDADNTGSDAIMAIDDFTITAVPEPTTIALGIFAAGLAAFGGLRAWGKKLKLSAKADSRNSES